MKQIYHLKITKRVRDIIFFRFELAEGERDCGIIDEIFREYVEEPILHALRIGGPIIKNANPPLLNKALDYQFIEDDGNSISFLIKGSLLNNRIIDRREMNTTDNKQFYLKMMNNKLLELENVPDRILGSAMAVIFLLSILDGMEVVVDSDDYIQSCETCVYSRLHIKKYIPLLDSFLRKELKIFLSDEKLGDCVLRWKGGKSECVYIRNTYPSINNIEKWLKTFFKR